MSVLVDGGRLGVLTGTPTAWGSLVDVTHPEVRPFFPSWEQQVDVLRTPPTPDLTSRLGWEDRKTGPW